MRPKSTISALLLLIIPTILLMYKDTPAQPRRSGAQQRPAAAEPAIAPPAIAYTVGMSKPSTHLLEVEMRIKWPAGPQTIELKMPVWSPGSYLIREYAKHVQDFEAATADGTKLASRKINKNTWAIDSARAPEVVVKYRVYANELTVRTNELNDRHAFWNNVALLMFPKGQLAAPSTVTVKPFGNWKVATGLKKASAPNTFRAENYDVLYDSPFEVSDFDETTFNVKGKPHRIVISGGGNYELPKLSKDIAKIVEAGYDIFGELPYDDYTFIVNTRGGGGLEHSNSTALQTNAFGFKPEARYRGFLGLVAHEFFHLWNVKRIRPDALGPFDYESENYTKLLWFAEGGTSYYEGILTMRAGLISPGDFLAGAARSIRSLQSRPGRLETSLEEASMDSWIKYYRPDENSVNNQVDYYQKGEVVTMMLDITIRSASKGTKSLDDVMRHLYTEFYKKGRNYTPEDLQKASELMAGRSLDDFFSKYVRGTEEIDYDSIMRGIGITAELTQPNRSRAYIGADLREENGRVSVTSVPSDTPAYEQGINTGDQLVAIDGYRVTTAFLQSYLNEKKPGDTVNLTVFRFDKLREMPFVLGPDTRVDFRFGMVESATDLQKRLYKQYVNEDLD